MKTIKRALRRHDRARLRKNRRHYWGGNANECAAKQGMVTETPHPCSCWLCGNQRKHFGATVQEQRAFQEKL